MNDDRSLVAETLSGKTESFEQLVRKYQDRLFTTLVHVTGCTHEAEEVTQDAMIQAYTKLSTFRGNSSFYTWLYRIAFNLSISRKRKKRPRVSLNQMQEDAGVDPPDSLESPEDVLQRSERANQLHTAMSKLTEEYRTILVLREMEDCDYDTIAAMLELPIGTVRSRLHRARSALREQLRQVIGDLSGA